MSHPVIRGAADVGGEFQDLGEDKFRTRMKELLAFEERIKRLLSQQRSGGNMFDLQSN